MKKQVKSIAAFQVSAFSLALLLTLVGTGNAQTVSVPNRIIDFLKKNYGNASETSRHFIYNAVDLNGDGKDEYLVGLIGNDWCGSGGCTMLVLDNNIRKIGYLTVVNYPVYVGTPGSSEVTGGYCDIYVENKDGSVSRMAWNGSGYPSNPSMATKTDRKTITGKFQYLNILEQDQLTF